MCQLRIKSQADEERRKFFNLGYIDRIAKRNITGIDIIDRSISRGVSKFVKHCKQNLGFEYRIIVDNTPFESVNKICKWIAAHSEKAHKILATRDDSQVLLLPNNSFFFKCDEATYVTVKTGDEFREMLTSNASLASVSLLDTRIKDGDMYIYVFGRKAYKYKKMIDKIISGRNGDVLRMYTIHGDSSERSNVSFRSLYQDMEDRDMSTIFMEDGVIEKITSHIDTFLANQDLYKGRGIIYKTGILLYGEPGTGKTSLIKALATKYHRDLILVDMSTFEHIGLETFVHSINIDDRKYIIALEDIDCVIADRENKDIDKDEKKIVNKLLQFLDSNSSPNDVIFIASTNHMELLDEALLRDGRFDVKAEINGIHEAKVIEMCKSFNLNSKQIASVLAEIKNEYNIDLSKNTIRQSKLQAIILKYSGMNLKADVVDEDELQEPDEDRTLSINLGLNPEGNIRTAHDLVIGKAMYLHVGAVEVHRLMALGGDKLFFTINPSNEPLIYVGTAKSVDGTRVIIELRDDLNNEQIKEIKSLVNNSKVLSCHYTDISDEKNDIIYITSLDLDEYEINDTLNQLMIEYEKIIPDTTEEKNPKTLSIYLGTTTLPGNVKFPRNISLGTDVCLHNGDAKITESVYMNMTETDNIHSSINYDEPLLHLGKVTSIYSDYAWIALDDRFTDEQVEKLRNIMNTNKLISWDYVDMNGTGPVCIYVASIKADCKAAEEMKQLESTYRKLFIDTDDHIDPRFDKNEAIFTCAHGLNGNVALDFIEKGKPLYLYNGELIIKPTKYAEDDMNIYITIDDTEPIIYIGTVSSVEHNTIHVKIRDDLNEEQLKSLKYIVENILVSSCNYVDLSKIYSAYVLSIFPEEGESEKYLEPLKELISGARHYLDKGGETNEAESESPDQGTVNDN